MTTLKTSHSQFNVCKINSLFNKHKLQQDAATGTYISVQPKYLGNLNRLQINFE